MDHATYAVTKKDLFLPEFKLEVDESSSSSVAYELRCPKCSALLLLDEEAEEIVSVRRMCVHSHTVFNCPRCAETVAVYPVGDSPHVSDDEGLTVGPPDGGFRVALTDGDRILAWIGYDAYGGSTGHKNYQGLPMPAWDDLPAAIREAWTAAARAISRSSR